MVSDRGSYTRRRAKLAAPAQQHRTQHGRNRTPNYVSVDRLVARINQFLALGICLASERLFVHEFAFSLARPLQPGGILMKRLTDEPASDCIEDPNDWKTGDEPLSGAQRSHLETLATEAARKSILT